MERQRGRLSTAMALTAAAFRACCRVTYRIGLESPALFGPPLSHSWRRNCLSFPHALLLVYLAAPPVRPTPQSRGSSHTGKPVTSIFSLPRVFLTRHPFWGSFQWRLTFQCGQPLPGTPFIGFLTLHFASYIWIPCSPHHLSFWSCTVFTGVLRGCDGS